MSLCKFKKSSSFARLYSMKLCVCKLLAIMLKFGSLSEFRLVQQKLARRATIFDEVVYLHFVRNYFEMRKFE